MTVIYLLCYLGGKILSVIWELNANTPPNKICAAYHLFFPYFLSSHWARLGLAFGFCRQAGCVWSADARFSISYIAALASASQTQCPNAPSVKTRIVWYTICYYILYTIYTHMVYYMIYTTYISTNQTQPGAFLPCRWLRFVCRCEVFYIVYMSGC